MTRKKLSLESRFNNSFLKMIYIKCSDFLQGFSE